VRLSAIKRLGRTIWKKWSGYHRRRLVEMKMHCFKLLGQHLGARAFVRQMTEFKVLGWKSLIASRKSDRPILSALYNNPRKTVVCVSCARLR
jgi:hypothetical protein